VHEVLVEVVEGGVGVVTLNAPERRNAISLELVAEVADALATLESSGDVGAVVITGAAPAFCAGAVLDTLIGSDRARLEKIYDGFLRVARSPLPTVAAVNGAAVGAGVNLALSCDVILAGESARFIARFLDLGVFPGGGHTWMMQRAVGVQGAFAMDVFGDELSGPEAAAAGLAWRCVPDDELADRALVLARFAASAPTETVQRLKSVINEMPTVESHDDAVAIEVEHQLWSLSTPEASERLAKMAARISSRSR